MLRKSLALTVLMSLSLLPAQAQTVPNNTGLTFASQDDLRGVPLAATPFSGAELPKKVDLSGNMPPPGNQGNQNSCVGWATAYALKTYQEKVEERRNLAPNGKVDPKMVFSPAFIYNQINNGRDGGSRFIDALNLMSEQGAVSLAQMPYKDNDYESPPPDHLLNQAKRYRIDYWRQVNIHDLKEVKAQLNAGYPVLIGAMIDGGFLKAKTGHVWNKAVGQSLGGHAMVLVGFDDTKKAFKVMNSWGTNWGEKGFGWISYSFFPKVVREGYVAKDALNGKAPAQPVQPTQPQQPQHQPEPEYEPEYEEPIADQAEFGIENVEFGLPAPSAQYEKYGPFMKLTGPVKIPAGAGKNMQVVVRFYFDDGNGGKGKPVYTRVPEIFSVANESIAATGTPQIPLGAQNIDSNWYALVPYSAFDLPTGKVDLVAEPMLYIDSFGIRTSELVHFWVDNPAPVNKPVNKQTNAPAQAAQAFFVAMNDEDYMTAWHLMSSSSQNQIAKILAEEIEVSTAEALAMFNNEDDLLMEHFWPSMRESMDIESWATQDFTVQSIQGNQATVLAEPVEVSMTMKLEKGSWKLGYIESFSE